MAMDVNLTDKSTEDFKTICSLTFRHHASYIQDRRTATPQSTIHIFSQQIYYLIIFLDSLSPSSFILPQNVVYFYIFSQQIYYLIINQTLSHHPHLFLHKMSCIFIYQSTNILFNYFFRLSLTIFVYSSTKCRVFLYISQQIYYLIIFFRLSPSSFILPQNVVYFYIVNKYIIELFLDSLSPSSFIPPQNVVYFYIFSQQIYYLIIFLDFLSPSSFIPPQIVVYFLMLHLLVHKIFTFYINGVLKCKCPAPGPPKA